MGDTCCLCFPLECGVKFLAFLNVLGTILLALACGFDESYAAVFWPLLIPYGLMSVTWVYTFASPSESSRHAAMMAYLIFPLFLATGYYAYCIWNGTALDYVCSEKNIEQANADIQQAEEGTGQEIGDPVTEKDCRYGGKTGLIVDIVLKALLELYFFSVVARWSRHKDGYSRN